MAAESTKDASERAKSYANEIANSTKVLEDFKLENEVKAPEKTKVGKFTDGLKDMASSALTGILNGVVNASIGMIASSAIEAGFGMINEFIHKNEIAMEEGESARDSIKVQTEAFDEQKKTLEGLTTEYTRLSKGVKITGNSIKNLSLSDEDFQSFIDTSNQIANIAPSLASGVDANGNFILEAGTNVNTLNKSIEDYLKLQRDVTHINTRESLGKQYEGLLAYNDETESKMDDLKSDLKSKEDAYKEAKASYESLKSIKLDDEFTVSHDESFAISQRLREAGIKFDDINEGVSHRYLIDVKKEQKKLDAMLTESENELLETSGEVSMAESKVREQQILQKAKWQELIPSIQSYINSSSMFDNLDSVTASQMRAGINSMVSNINYSNIEDAVYKAGGIGNWIDENLIAPIASSQGKVHEAWKGIFNLEEMRSNDEITIGKWAEQRNEYLKTIAEARGEDWKTIAARLGYGSTDEEGTFVWGMKSEIERASKKLFGNDSTENEFNELRGWLDSLTNKDYEIAIDMILDSEQTFASVDEVKKAFNSARLEAEEAEKESSLSLTAMQEQVTEARSMATALSAGVNEALSKGGLSTDTVNLLTSQFDTIKDEFQRAFPDKDLGFIESNLGQLFANTSDGVKLNIDALEQLSKVRADIRDDKFYESIEANKKAIENAIDADELEELKGFRKGILQEQSQWMAIKKQQEEFFSDYSAWGRAQNSANEGDKYVSMVSGLKSAKDAYDHGLVGTDDFKTFAALISPTSSDDALNFAENYNKAQRYLTQDKTGVDNFLADLKAKDLAEYNEEMKRWTFNIDDMDKAAHDLGINTEFLAANFGRLRDYGIDNNIISNTEDGISRIQELTQGLAKEENRLEWLKENDKDNTTAISGSEKKVNDYKYNIQETLKNIGTVTESTISEISANYDAAVLGIRAYDDAITEVSKNESMSENERAATITRIQAMQEDLAESVGSTVDKLREESSIDMTEVLGDPTKQESYTNVIDSINSALNDQNSEVASLIDTISKYSFEELSSINFGDGKWDDSIGDAEKAVESLTTALGLTKEQTDVVIEALKSMHKLKGEEEQSSSKPSKPSPSSKLEFSTPSNDKLAIVNQRIADTKAVLDNLYRKQNAGIEVDSSKIEQAELKLQRLLETKETLSQKTVIEIDAQIEHAQSRIQDLQAQINAASQGGFNPGHEHIIANAQSEIGILQSKITGFQQLKVEVETGSVKSASEEVEALDKQQIAPKTVDVKANAFGAISMLNSVQAAVNSIPSSKTVTITTNHINRTINMTESQSKYGPHTGYVSNAAGTMLSPAHASGTAYNVLNLKPISSYASGKVSLEKDEPALINELGQESIIRDGVWSLIPGKMHVENLKKGDIILNVKQTRDLLQSGKTNSFVKAYSSGTSPRIRLNDDTKRNTDAIKENTQVTQVTGEALDKAIDTINNSKDWIETKLSRDSDKTDLYREKAESDYVSVGASQKYFDKAESALKTELNNTIKAKDKYTKKAEQVAKEVGLSSDLKKKVQNGTIDIQSLSEDDKKRVEAYSQWYEKIVACTESIRDLKDEQDKLAESRFQNTIDKFDSIAGIYSSKQEYYQALRENRVAHGLSQYPQGEKGSVWYQQIGKEKDYVLKEKATKEKSLAQLKKDAADYLKVKGNSKSDIAYKNMISSMTDLKTEIIKLDTTAANLEQEMRDAKLQHIDWKVEEVNRKEGKHEAILDYKGVSDRKEDQITEKDYEEGIRIDSEQINMLYKKREELIRQYREAFATSNNEKAQEYLDKLAETEQEIIKNQAEIEEKKNAIMELRLKPYYDAQKALSDVINEYQTLQKLLGDTESFFNDDGSFTTNGLANIVLLQESIDATKTTIANATKQLDILQQHYANGNLSEEEYKERTEEVMETIRNSSTALAEYKQQMLGMYETQIKMENSLLVENIDKRLQALDAKEKYYEYDKTIKKKSKDINALKAQIAALEGTSNAAAKARLEKLKAELSDAEEDMDDTVHKHEQEMKKYGYEQLQNEAETALENTLDALKKNTAFQEAVISQMLDTTKANYDEAYNHLNEVIKQHGLVVTETYNQMVGAVADFNDKAVQFTPPDASVNNQDTSHIETDHNGSGNKVDNVINSSTPTTMLEDVQKWYSKLKDWEGPPQKGASGLATYIMKKGKIANRYEFQELADILEIPTPGPENYDEWGVGKLDIKNKMLKKLKEIGFSKGGIVDYGRYIPINTLDELVHSNGEWGMVAARRKELILNEHLSELLQTGLPTAVDIIRKFNTNNAPGETVGRVYNDNTVYEVNIYVDKISNDMDIKKLASAIDVELTKAHVKDMRKLIG